MRVRMITAMGVVMACVAPIALVSSAATASKSHRNAIAKDAAGLLGRGHGAVKRPSREVSSHGLCGTAFGDELPTPDGLISWNDAHHPQTGYDVSGAADFTCSAATTIHKVWAYGFFGAKPTDLFNVTFYYNDPSDGSNEANDADLFDGIACHFSNIVGAAGGDGIKGPVLTKLRFGACRLPPGEFWVAVQNNNPAGPWYWEMQAAQQGDAPDWRDINDSFEDGCTSFDGNGTGNDGGDEYLQGCLGYKYGDYMVVLK